MRVEWTLLSGEDAEMLVAMLLCSQMPNATHLRPGQGDGGVDVFDPGPEGLNVERDVYQVKRFTGALTSSHKRQIKRSFARVNTTSADEGWLLQPGNLANADGPRQFCQTPMGRRVDRRRRVFLSVDRTLTQCNILAATDQATWIIRIYGGRERLYGAMEAEPQWWQAGYAARR